MDMSVPYDPAVANLSLSDPNCINAGDECTAYYAAQNASQAAVSWAYQFEYGHWATYYYVIGKIPSMKSFLRTGASLLMKEHFEAFRLLSLFLHLLGASAGDALEADTLGDFTLTVLQSSDCCFWPMSSLLSRII